MALFGQKFTEDQLIERAAARFREKIMLDTTAAIFSDYLEILEQIQNASGNDEQVGFLLLRNYRTFSALYEEVFAEDYKAVKALKGDQIGDIFMLFQKAATSPLPSAPSEPGAGADPSQGAPTA